MSNGRPTVQEERENLILKHLTQVRAIARRIHERLPANVCMDDLVSAGILGLIAAIDNFDNSHNTKLKTYAEVRIRGAIIDSLRAMDWAPRLKRRKSKEIESAIAAAEQKLQRAPTEEEIAAALGTSVEEYRKWLLEVHGLNLGPLRIPEEGGGSNSCLACVMDSEENLPSHIVERAELERLIAEGIERMPPVERMVLSLYYQQDMAPYEIAQIMNMRPSRVSQVKAQGVMRLHAYMEKRLSRTKLED